MVIPLGNLRERGEGKEREAAGNTFPHRPNVASIGRCRGGRKVPVRTQLPSFSWFFSYHSLPRHQRSVSVMKKYLLGLRQEQRIQYPRFAVGAVCRAWSESVNVSGYGSRRRMELGLLALFLPQATANRSEGRRRRRGRGWIVYGRGSFSVFFLSFHGPAVTVLPLQSDGFPFSAWPGWRRRRRRRRRRSCFCVGFVIPYRLALPLPLPLPAKVKFYIYSPVASPSRLQISTLFFFLLLFLLFLPSSLSPSHLHLNSHLLSPTSTSFFFLSSLFSCSFFSLDFCPCFFGHLSLYYLRCSHPSSSVCFNPLLTHA